MRSLVQVLAPEDILIDVEAVSKETLLENLAQFIEWRHGVSASFSYRSLIGREALGSTGIGKGVAIPHARIKGMASPVGVLARTRRAIEFGAPDGEPVSVVLVLLVPEEGIALHLQLLARAADLFSDKNFMEELRASSSPRSIHALLGGWLLPA